MTYFAGNVTKIEFTCDFRDTRKLRKNKQVIKTGIPFFENENLEENNLVFDRTN